MHFAVDGGSKDLLGPETFFHELASEPIRLPKASLTPSTLPDESQVVLLEARGRSSSTAGAATAGTAAGATKGAD
jgi:hypothetical protein